MEKSKEHIRHCLLYEYQLSHSARQATRNICRVIGLGSLSHVTASRWFLRFDEKDYSLSDEVKSGHQTIVDDDELKALIKSDPRQTTRCLASKLQCSHVTIASHLNQLGYRYLHTIWIPHTLSLDLASQRMDMCYDLINKKRNFQWLDNLVTGDEKWVMYVNIAHKKQWLERGQLGIPTPKPDLHPTKVMLCVWWGVKGVYYWELLPTNTTVTAMVYTEQLERLKARIETEHPELNKIYFLHDNARPHVAKLTREKKPSLAGKFFHIHHIHPTSLQQITIFSGLSVANYETKFLNKRPILSAI